MNGRRIAYSADELLFVWAWRDARAAERAEAGEP